jgi:hypothetical protein
MKLQGINFMVFIGSGILSIITIRLTQRLLGAGSLGKFFFKPRISSVDTRRIADKSMRVGFQYFLYSGDAKHKNEVLWDRRLRLLGNNLDV